MQLIPHIVTRRVLSELNDMLHESDYRKPVANGLLETILKTDGYLSPDLLPVVRAFLVSLRRACDDAGSHLIGEQVPQSLIVELDQCIEDSERYEIYTYCVAQRNAFMAV